MRTLEEIEKEIEKLEKEKKEVEKTKREMLEKEKENRRKEVIDAYDKYKNLREKYAKDYGVSINSNDSVFKDYDGWKKLFDYCWYKE